MGSAPPSSPPAEYLETPPSEGGASACLGSERDPRAAVAGVVRAAIASGIRNFRPRVHPDLRAELESLHAHGVSIRKYPEGYSMRIEGEAVAASDRVRIKRFTPPQAYVLIRRLVNSRRPVHRRPTCGHAPRSGSNARTHGSRRGGTSTRGSPDDGDPDPPSEHAIAAHRRPKRRAVG
jgi:hypothetical protein